MAYPALQQNNQLHLLPTQSLEEYYPGQFKQTAAQVAELSKSIGLKREMARHVGKNATQQQVEAEMPIIAAALNQCWKAAYE